MRTFIHHITRLRPVSMGIAAGLLAAGVLAIVGGTYAHQVVKDQLGPQNITFPADAKSGLPEDLSQYAGQRVDTGAEAKAFAEKYIGLHLQEIGGGKTYSEVSAAALADPNNEKLAQQAQTLFRGETLRGLLLNAWGWSTVGTVALIGGIVMLIVGGILFLLPALDWLLNDRRAPAAKAAPARPAASSGD